MPNPRAEASRFVENFVGSAGRDTLEGTNANDVFTINAPNAGALNALSFSSFETLRGLNGADLFRFVNQATVDGSVDGGAGFDTLWIDDTNFGGGGAYTISAGLIARNPVYRFSGIETIRIDAGKGNDFFNTGFLPGIAQILNGGGGQDTLFVTGALFPADSPLFGVIGNVTYGGFEILLPQAPGNQVVVDDSGGLLQIQLNQALPQLDLGGLDTFNTIDNFEVTGGDSALSLTGLGIGAQLGTAGAGDSFAAAGVGAGGGLTPGMAIFGISLDGSGALPSQFVQALIAVNLGIFSRSELSLALGGEGEVPVESFDGPIAVDASGDPATPGVIAWMLFHLGPEALSQLSAALGGGLAAPLDSAGNPIAIALDGTRPSPVVIGFFAANLGPQARSELSLALGGFGEIPLFAGDGAIAMDGSGTSPPATVLALLQAMLNELSTQELE